MKEPTDAEALRASRAKPQAFVLVFERHFAAVHRYLRRRVPTDLADELVAETFLRAFARRETYRAKHADALPWLYGIATNLLRQYFRREERELHAFARTRIDTAQTPAPLDPAGAELAYALAHLSDGERDVLFLHAWAELGYEQIAGSLGLPLGTVRSRLHRARAKLRELLPRDGQDVARAVEREKGTMRHG